LHPEPGRALSAEFHYPLGEAGAAMRRWRDLSSSAQREATFAATISAQTVTLGFVWVGDPAQGVARASALADELADAGEPAGRSIEYLSYLQLQTREDDVERHAWRRYWKGHYFSELDDDVIDALLARDGDDLPDVSLQAYGGAIADMADDATAFSRRDAAFEFVAAARWQDSAEDDRRIAAARRYAGAMDRFASGAYVNVLGDDGETGIRRAYSGQQLARLTTVKDAYDPGNLFHLNQNIRPSTV